MKSKWIIMPAFAALCIFAACSEKNTDVAPPGTDPIDTPVTIDSSKCLLTGVNYQDNKNMPYFRSSFTLAYDSAGRIKERQVSGVYNRYSYESGKVTLHTYINSVADSNLVQINVYILDNNNNIVYNTEAYYNKPKSESDYTRKDSTSFIYNGEGYLTGQKSYAFGSYLMEESNYIYQDGNMVKRERTQYEFYISPVVKRGTDTLSYTYDKTPCYPEAAYLCEVGDFRDIRTGKLNKNNVTGINLRFYNTAVNQYSTIQYTYQANGPKVKTVMMSATTTQGLDVNAAIDFTYKCK